jgi:ketosteroid isomerase-like protein
MSSVRRAVLAAYRSLAAGDVTPLVGLLSDDVEWIETRGLRSKCTRGRAAVTDVLRKRAAIGPLRGIVVRRNALVLDFGRSTQTVSFASEIERIECSSWPRR